MRTFTLIDKDNNSYDITAKNRLFFYNIDNLGFKQETEWQRIEDRYALLSNYTKQAVISGTVRFWDTKDLTAEEAYFKFAQFCQNAPMKMKYNPGHGEYFRNGYVTKIERSDGDKTLTVKLDFSAQTPWYKSVSQYNSGIITGGKVYDYEYNYTYSQTTINAVTVDSDSFQSSPCKLIVYGPAVNPSWQYYLNGVLQLSGKVNGSVLENHRLIIDTTTIPYSIKQVDMLGNVVSDMYQQSDFSTDRFVRMGYGRNTVAFTADNTNILNVAVEAQIEYATV